MAGMMSGLITLSILHLKVLGNLPVILPLFENLCAVSVVLQQGYVRNLYGIAGWYLINYPPALRGGTYEGISLIAAGAASLIVPDIRAPAIPCF
jgi:hypothetical protein